MSGSLTVTRGLPGAGKSTYALAWVAAADEPHQRVRVNRDETRANLFGTMGRLTFEQEQTVTIAQRASIAALLAAGRDVIVDDTNLRLAHVRAFHRLAEQAGVPFEVIDLFIPLEDCIAHDAARAAAGGRGVGEEAIRGLARRFNYPLAPYPGLGDAQEDATALWRPYRRTGTGPRAWIIDIDGTVATHEGLRDHHDYAQVIHDDPIPAVIDIVNALCDYDGIEPVFVSGRAGTEQCRTDTETWLAKHVRGWELSGQHLFMRTAGDGRSDDVVKYELFDQHIRDRWDVVGVLDDRDRVVAMWRHIGLRCLQVAPGAF